MPVCSHLPQPQNPDLLARVSLGRVHAPQPDEQQLFEAISRRRTHRASFDLQSVPETVLEPLRHDAKRAGAELHVFIDKPSQERVAALVGADHRTQFEKPGFRRELASWLRRNRTRHRDGIPGYAFGVGDFVSLLLPQLIATRRHRPLCGRSPLRPSRNS